MSLYAEYVRERLGDEIYETEDAFATYRFINEKQVYIIDLYVKPEKRKLGLASAISDSIVDIARKHGRSELIGSVVPSAKTSTGSMKAFLAYGMQIQSSANDFIVLKKDI